MSKTNFTRFCLTVTSYKCNTTGRMMRWLKGFLCHHPLPLTSDIMDFCDHKLLGFWTGGRRLTNTLATIVVPARGRPMSRMLCWSAAAICRARFACVCPRTSSIMNWGGEVGGWVMMVSDNEMNSSFLRWRNNSFKLLTLIIVLASIRIAWVILALGIYTVWNPTCLATSIVVITPRIGPNWPLSDNSSTNTALSTSVCRSCPLAINADTR